MLINRLRLVALTVLLALASTARAEPPQDASQDAGPTDCWFNVLDLGAGFGLSTKDALHWKSPDGNVSFKIGGRMQYDYAWIDGGNVREDRGLDLEDQGEFRRLRLYLSGDLYKTVDFKFQFDFAEEGTTLKDFYARLKQIPAVGNFKIGHFKEPFSLEDSTSSKYITFIERGLPNALAPGHNWGMMLHNHAFDKRMTWAAGVFKAYHDDHSPKWGSSSQGEAFAATGRVTFLPYYEDEGRRLIHLGAAYSVRRPEHPIKFSARPEAHMTKKLSDTSSIYARRVHLIGAEAAWVCGPFSVQGEYMGALIDGEMGKPDVTLHGMYVQTSYILTGETRPYDTKTGAFKGIKPKNNFITGNGPGAWEVAARYSYLDLTGNGLSSKAYRMQDLTLGLNWYLNPNIRISGNYIRSWLNGPSTSDAVDIFMLRFQIAF